MFQDKYLPIIVQEVNNIRKTYGLNANSPIGDYIFAILKNECILVEWPEENLLDLDGFSTEKVVDGRLSTIVYINSAKNKDITKYMTTAELKRYLKTMGIAEEDIQLIEDMKKIETETIDVVDNNEKADF